MLENIFVLFISSWLHLVKTHVYIATKKTTYGTLKLIFDGLLLENRYLFSHTYIYIYTPCLTFLRIKAAKQMGYGYTTSQDIAAVNSCLLLVCPLQRKALNVKVTMFLLLIWKVIYVCAKPW